MKSLLAIIFTLSILLFPFQKNENVKLVFKNDSKEIFKELHVNIRGKKYDFTNLNSKDKTVPIKVDGTYWYCYAKVVTEKDTLIIQPEDFVGEELITKGKYVMKFRIVEKNGKRYLVIKRKTPANSS